MGTGPIVVVEERDGSAAAVGLWMRTGSASEPDGYAGITHFLEHLLLRRTARRGPESIAELMDSLGGDIDAFTTREVCALSAFVPAERFDEALDLLVDAMFSPAPTDEDVRVERGVIDAEFDMVQDSPGEVAAELALEACWGGHPLARPVLGRRPVVAGLRREDLLSYHELEFTPARLIAVAVGPVDPSALERRLSGLPAGEGTVERLSVPTWHPGLLVEPRDGIEQAYVNLVFPALASADEEIATLGALHQLLGAGASSRLFRELRDRRGIAYDVSSAVYSGSVAGVLEVTFSAPLRNLEACWDAIARVLDDVAAGRIADREVELARQALRAGVVVSSEGCDAIMEGHAGEMLARGRRFDLATVLAEIDQVTPERVRALARRLVRMDDVSGAVCGPSEGLLLPGWLRRRAA